VLDNKSKMRSSRSSKLFEEGDSYRNRNGGVNNKLLQENAILMDKL